MTERQYESMAHRDVTRMAKIMVAAAGGEIAIPKAWLDQNRYIDIELEQTESGGKVIYKARWLRDAPGATIDIAAQYRKGFELIEDDRIRRLPHAKSPTGRPHPVLPGPTKSVPGDGYAFSEDECPGHVGLDENRKLCRLCGVHVDSLRPDADGED